MREELFGSTVRFRKVTRTRPPAGTYITRCKCGFASFCRLVIGVVFAVVLTWWRTMFSGSHDENRWHTHTRWSLFS